MVNQSPRGTASPLHMSKHVSDREQGYVSEDAYGSVKWEIPAVHSGGSEYGPTWVTPSYSTSVHLFRGAFRHL